MSKKAVYPQSRRHILVYDEDWEYLDRRYGKNTTSRIGMGAMIRNMIHLHVKALREREERKAEELRRQLPDTREPPVSIETSPVSHTSPLKKASQNV